ncbi:hypothetical protein AYL99_00892 [Fonsecaea erecta]|uniref:Cell wall mannoprotein PIR1-like C-terminal domain-containing protein n=1 Tax=Fonsecaea erecta TaxID=1367422 RepID=A0A178ZYI0_9EURO|nr:hypothetical protein AYL99_00892 [Fonsecaea erecta]OAP64920.1 hypothetical protein AYL99_00892 [Fonsecaea erecta]
MIHPLSISILFYSWAVSASPIASPLAVTAAISPPQAPPPGCTGSFPGVFGIALMNISMSASASGSGVAGGRLRVRRQGQAPPAPIFTMGVVSQIGDGQVQGGMHTAAVTMALTPLAPVSQIGDGQIQGPVVTAGVPDNIAVTTPTTASSVVPTSSVPVPVPIPFPPQGQDHPSAAATPSKPPTVIEQACGFSTRPSLVPPPSTSSIPPSPTSPDLNAAPSSSSSSYSSISSPSPTSPLVSCLTNSTLRLHLSDNNLYDAFNRTGYIASNYQFQFDGPPQAGALWTSGWSICPVDNNNNDNSANGDGGDNSTIPSASPSDGEGPGISTLALGDSTTFWQCLSGDFYNLYTENWAAQCSPVELRVVSLVDCGGGR